MLPEEATMQFVALGQLSLHERVNPGGITLLDAVTVRLIVHDLTSADTVLLINLPKHHATVLGDTKVVLLGGMAQLVVGHITTIQERLAENT